MFSSAFPSMRKEVQDYLRSAEHLLAAAVTPNAPPFSEEELELVEYYAMEISKLHAFLVRK